jgi:hypothetical protein
MILESFATMNYDPVINLRIAASSPVRWCNPEIIAATDVRQSCEKLSAQ